MSTKPPAARRCPECGEELLPDATGCWICQRVWDVAEVEVVPPQDARQVVRRPPPPFQFRLQTLLLFIACIAVVLGVFRLAQGFAILLAGLLAIPVFVAMARSNMVGQSLLNLIVIILVGCLMVTALMIGVFLTCLFGIGPVQRF